MRLLSLVICVVAVLGAKNPECPNEIASEECEDDCVRANTECILECDDGNCVRVVFKMNYKALRALSSQNVFENLSRECSREYTRCESKCPCFDEPGF